MTVNLGSRETEPQRNPQAKWGFNQTIEIQGTDLFDWSQKPVLSGHWLFSQPSRVPNGEKTLSHCIWIILPQMHSSEGRSAHPTVSIWAPWCFLQGFYVFGHVGELTTWEQLQESQIDIKIFRSQSKSLKPYNKMRVLWTPDLYWGFQPVPQLHGIKRQLDISAQEQWEC